MKDENGHFLEEYKLAQDRVNHFERLIWQIGSILNGTVVILFGLALRIDNQRFVPFVILISILFSVLWYLFEIRYRQINLVIFRRLIELEKLLNFRIHSRIREEDKSRKLKIKGHYLIAGTAFGVPFIILSYYIFFKFAHN